MIPASTSASAVFDGDQQAATVTKESPKNRSKASAPNFDGNNQNTLANSALYASSTHSAEPGENGRFPNSAGNSVTLQKSIASMVSFNSSSDEGPDVSRSNELSGNKVDVVYTLFSMLSSHDRLQSSQMLLSVSKDRENCQLIRRPDCMNLLIQLLHPSDTIPLPPPTGDELEVIRRATEALNNIVRHDDDEERSHRDMLVLILLEHVRNYVLHLRLVLTSTATYQSRFCEPAYNAMATLTKLSYNEEQRRSTCILGGLQCIAEALILDQKIFNNNCPPMNLDFRRFIGMTLTNLTFGASETKRTLCSSGQFLQALNAQIATQPEELRQVFAGVLRNLSWKTDANSKTALKDAGTVKTLMQAAMEAQKEPTLKSILSALWNLSSHCSENKTRICTIPSALEFLVSTLAYKSPSGSMAVVESGGGILRNVSSNIALKEEYRAVLRQHNCFQILLELLQSHSLTIVSNACGTLWNLSAHSIVDQKALRQMGAEKKLRDLVHSKHKMISWGSSATLKNLMASRPKGQESSSNSSTISNPDKRNYNLMKLRQHKSSTEKEGDDSELMFVCSHPGTTSSRSLLGDQAPDGVLSMPSPQRRQTPTMEIAAMLNDVTRTVVLKSGTPPLFRMPATPPPKINDRMSTSQVMNDASTNMDQSRSQRMHSSTISASYSLPSSKEEQIQCDKAAVHRFHNSLRRSSQPHTRMDSCDDRQLGFPSVIYRNSTHQVPPQQQSYGMYYDQAAANFVATGPMTSGFPMKNPHFTANTETDVDSKRGSPEKHKGLDGTALPKQEISQNQQRMPFRKPSGPTTPAEFRSEPSSRGSKSVTALTPLMFSRQSSMESLDSCDQHSMRSTVYSEYSQLPTGLPSPSELPDSPTNTLPPVIIGERKTQIFPQQRVCNMDERRISEPGSVTGLSSAPAAAAMVFPCYSDIAASQTKKVAADEEKPRIYGKMMERDEEEKPKIFGKLADRSPQVEFESNKLSASSSLSALTIDSDIKPKGAKLPNDQNIFVFNSDQHEPSIGVRDGEVRNTRVNDVCQELQECILAARPTPKTNDTSKVPRSFYQPGTKPVPTARMAVVSKPTSATTIDSAAAREDEADLRHVMQSAMPKPKTVRSKTNNVRVVSPHRRGNHNLGVVRPMPRASAENIRMTPVAAPSDQQVGGATRAKDVPRTAQSEDPMEKSEEVLQCIAMALPKPKTARKSKSLDRKTQRRDLAVAFTNNVDNGQIRPAANDTSTSSGTVLMPVNYEQDDSRALLMLSCSSALMNSATTAERVKDATILFDSSNSIGTRTPPVARIAPKPQSGNTSVSTSTPQLPTPIAASTIVAPGKNDPSSSKDSAKRDTIETEGNDDSLSEDNYSQLYDESFNLEPEDLDVDSIRDEEWLMGAANENLIEGCADITLLANGQLPSPTELLIDCETFSATSKDSIADDYNDGAPSGRPRILKSAETTSETKIIKGGRRMLQGNLAAKLAAPKVTVRTTKATELRAKKTQQQSPSSKNGGNGLRAPSVGNSRSRSMSPAIHLGSPTLSARRATDFAIGKTSPNRFRHNSSSSGCRDGQLSPLTVAKDRSQKEAPKSPNVGRQQPLGNPKTKRELGSNVKRKIESLQKRESASEDDPTSPLMLRKARNAVSTKPCPKSPKAAVKNHGDRQASSNKGQDGKRALVTTV